MAHLIFANHLMNLIKTHSRKNGILILIFALDFNRLSMCISCIFANPALWYPSCLFLRRIGIFSPNQNNLKKSCNRFISKDLCVSRYLSQIVSDHYHFKKRLRSLPYILSFHHTTFTQVIVQNAIFSLVNDLTQL
jgi:hypothetical protein